ncbi:hypothetical protein R1sor_019313 [Riccia sorocarpa]|uniref:Uncharacterized protein n=1 Tax=Riccia sorocarpa TaxID=122646 RepID=A0ABD3IGC0_9MARC
MGSLDDHAGHKDAAAEHIKAWASEKGYDAYVCQLLKLLDEEYLKSFAGIRKIPLPRRKACGVDDRIPNRHWRYRFYHGVAAVLGWEERVTFGDDRYWGEDFHQAIKNLWPDERGSSVPSKPAASPSTVFTSNVAIPLHGVITCKIECSCSLDTSSPTATSTGVSPVQKKRRLPNWIQFSTPIFSNSESESFSEDEENSHSTE